MFILTPWPRGERQHMTHLMDWGKAQGHTEFQLEVFAENQCAKRLQKMGLVPEILTMRLDNIPDNQG